MELTGNDQKVFFADLYTEINLNMLLEKIIEKIKKIIGCEEAAIFLYNTEREELYFETVTGEKKNILQQIVLKKGEGVVGWIAENNQPVIINDCSKDDRFTATTDKESNFTTRSIAGIPVNINDKLLGVIEAINKTDGDFTEQDMNILQKSSSHIAIPLQNALLFRQINDECKEKKHLIELAKLISISFDLNQVFDRVKSIVQELLEIKSITIYVKSSGQTYNLVKSDETSRDSIPGEINTTDFQMNKVIFPLKTEEYNQGLMEIIAKNRIPESFISLLKGLAVFIAISIEKYRFHEERVEKEKIKKELEIAKEIQDSFLPSQNIQLQGIDTSYVNIASSEVGGDYYDIISIDDNNTIFHISDIAGHGISASMLMAIVRTNFLYEIRKESNILATINYLNDLIARTTEPQLYLTSFTCRINLSGKKLTYLNAGHIAPLIIRKGQAIELKERSAVIGMFEGIEYKIVEEDLKSNDLIIIYTDGVSEAENEEGKQFSGAGLKQFLIDNANLETAVIRDKLIRDLQTFTGRENFEDDVTFILFKIL